MKRFIKWLHDYWEGELDCPAYWWSQGWDDCDEGCYLWNHFECWDCKYRFLPNFVIKWFMAYSLWKLDRYYGNQLKKMDKEAR